jgi:bifunctional DNA-binding transcriptional regulator/antitoxin component of YhaV-PrlF toxin-antitoxin module
MSADDNLTITFSKAVDEKGRLVIPKEHRQALTIEGRKALVEFEATKVTYLDQEADGGDD